MVIDEELHVRTPEGAELVLPLAGPVPRAAAWLLDLLIRIGMYLALGMALGFLGHLGIGFMLIGIFLLEWFYPVLFEAFWHGQTPGKRVLGIAVVHGDGTPLTFNGSLIRNLLRTADFFPFAYLAGLLSIFASRHFQRLGDLAADTLVVHVDEPSRAAMELPLPPTPALPDWPATLTDRQVLVSFAERARRLTKGRRQELAQKAFPELPGPEAEQRLLALAAQWLGET